MAFFLLRRRGMPRRRRRKEDLPPCRRLSGTRIGIAAVVAFFDTMGTVMGSANPHVERLVLGVNDDYVVECQHLWTDRTDVPNLDQQLCVLWRMAHGKIVHGQHLVADQDALDMFFFTLLRPQPE